MSAEGDARGGAAGSAVADEPQILTLPDLLRKCHRDELLPLAEALRVNPKGLGLGKLAEVMAWALCRHGGHELGNFVLRQGKGPPYNELILGLARRCGVKPGRDVPETEVALMEWWLARALDDMDAEQRANVWKVLGMQGVPPEPGSTALEVARQGLGKTFGLRAGLVAAGTVGRVAHFALLPIVGPILPMASLLWMGRPRDEVLLPVVLEVARLRQLVRHRVTVGIVGSPSSGKDAAIGAIFGLPTGNVHPVAGSTKKVSIVRVPGASALFLVNTPGMGDVIESVTEQARQVLDHIDLFVYVLNAQGGVQARELADYQGCLARRRPVLVVVNKIDTLRPRDLERYLDDARGKLGVDEEDFLAAAFDPLPQLADAPIGVEAVRDWIAQQLNGLGKDVRELPWVPSAEEPHDP